MVSLSGRPKEVFFWGGGEGEVKKLFWGQGRGRGGEGAVTKRSFILGWVQGKGERNDQNGLNIRAKQRKGKG